MPPGPEKKFENKLRAALKSRGALVIKIAGGQFSRDLPDMLVAHDGLLTLCENKHLGTRAKERDNKFLLSRLSPGQMFRAREFHRAGVRVWVACGDAKTERGYLGGTGLRGKRPRITIDDMADQILELTEAE